MNVLNAKREWCGAIFANNQQKIISLLKSDSNIEWDCDYNSNSALHIAVLKENTPLINLRINNGANVNSKNIFVYTPLDLASNIETKKLIVANGGTSTDQYTIIANELNLPEKAIELLEDHKRSINQDDETTNLSIDILIYQSYIRSITNTKMIEGNNINSAVGSLNDASKTHNYEVVHFPDNNNYVSLFNLKNYKNTIEILLERTILQNPKFNPDLKNILVPHEKNPLLREVFTIVVLYALSNPEFITVILDNKIDMPFLRNTIMRLNKDIGFARGLTTDDMVIASCSNKVNQECIGTLLHEYTHLAMLQVYKNRGNPYRENDIEKHTIFNNMALKTVENVYKYFLKFNPEVNCAIPREVYDNELFYKISCGHYHRVKDINLFRLENNVIFSLKEMRILEIIDRVPSEYSYNKNLFHREFAVRLPQLLGEGLNADDDLILLEPFINYWQTEFQCDAHNIICLSGLHNYIENIEC